MRAHVGIPIKLHVVVLFFFFFLLLFFLHMRMPEEGKTVGSNCWDFGLFHHAHDVPSGDSRLHWLNGEQATKFKVLDHGEFLQTLENGRTKKK